MSEWRHHVLCFLFADMSLKEALEFLVSLAKEKKKEQMVDQGELHAAYDNNNNDDNDNNTKFI